MCGVDKPAEIAEISIKPNMSHRVVDDVLNWVLDFQINVILEAERFSMITILLVNDLFALIPH